MGILRQAGAFRPVGGGWGGEAVCGRGAAGGSRHGGITSGTAGSRNAWRKCGAGRRRSGNRSAGPNLRARQRHAEAERQRRKQRASAGPTPPEGEPAAADAPRSLRVVTQQKASARFFATVPAVTSRRGILLAPRRRIVATTAARPCVRPATANASGCGARPKRADSSVAWNTRPHGPNAVKIVSLPAAWRRGGPSARPGTKRALRSVLFYRRDGDGAVDSRAPTEVIAHDSQSNSWFPTACAARRVTGGRGLIAVFCGSTPRDCRTRRSCCTSSWPP